MFRESKQKQMINGNKRRPAYRKLEGSKTKMLAIQMNLQSIVLNFIVLTMILTIRRTMGMTTMNINNYRFEKIKLTQKWKVIIILRLTDHHYTNKIRFQKTKIYLIV